jgi:pimeloyl-ACP methyl ester carboxylesterase
VNPARIFLTGWSAGGYAVLFTGLRHPEIFRALSVRQGNFRPDFLEPCIAFLDRQQPIQIMFGQVDLLVKDQTLAAIDWLRQQGIEPTVVERTGAHRRDPMPVFEFFAEVVRKRPWVRVIVTDEPTDPMQVHFGTKTSFEPERFLWDFGDGSPRSPLAAPEHRFEEPGLYTVRVALWPARGGPYVREIALQVPRIRIGATR